MHANVIVIFNCFSITILISCDMFFFCMSSNSPSDESDIFGENEDDIHDLFSDMKTKNFFERRNTESDLFEDSPEHKC